MTVREQYRELEKVLEEVTEEPAAEAMTILAHVYGMPPGRLVMRFFDEAAFRKEAASVADERARTGRPLAYILGTRNFCGLDFFVDERVLIPRLDTEQMTMDAAAFIADSGAERAADICCGSGCIGITLLRNTDIDEVIFADISRDALDVAKMNAQALGVVSRARFVCADFLAAVDRPVDLIVCNPPYIREDDFAALEAQVRDWEPKLALTARRNGMEFYERLGEGALRSLAAGGALFAETGDGQARAAAEILQNAGFADVAVGRDVSGAERYVQGRKKHNAE